MRNMSMEMCQLDRMFDELSLQGKWSCDKMGLG